MRLGIQDEELPRFINSNIIGEIMGNKKDVIIIGGGIGGLISGVSLSNKGYKVHIFEKLNQPGGYANTFRRNGFLFESSIHFHMGFNVHGFLSGIIDKLGLEGINFIDLEYSAELFRIQNESIARSFLIRSGKQEFIKYMLEYFPAEEKTIMSAAHMLEKASKDILRLIRLEKNNPLMHPFDLFSALFLMIGKDGSIMKKIGSASFKNIAFDLNKTVNDLFGFIKNPDIREILIHCAYYTGTPIGRLSGLVVVIMAYLIILNKPQVIKGGTQVLIDSCVDKIRKNGGEISYGSEVKTILMKDKTAVGIKLEGNEEHHAEYVISNVNAVTTYTELIGEKDILDADTTGKLGRYSSTHSGFNIYLGLPYDLRKFGYQSSMNIFLPDGENTLMLEKDCTLRTDNIFFVTNFSVSDPEFAPPGKSSIVISNYARYEDWAGLSKDEYLKKKSSTIDFIIKRASKLTGLPLDKNETCLAATPLTFKRYSGNIKGGFLGNDLSCENAVVNRFGQKTCIKNLYHVGSDTKPAGSFCLAFLSGILTGNNISRGF